MRGKVGMYVRTKSNYIAKISYVNDDKLMFERGVHLYSADDIVEVANTPQELIQVGDLYTDNHNRKYECLLVQNGVLYSHYFGLAKPCGTLLTNVTSILTPNANGGFDLQWSDEQ